MPFLHIIQHYKQDESLKNFGYYPSAPQPSKLYLSAEIASEQDSIVFESSETKRFLWCMYRDARKSICQPEFQPSNTCYGSTEEHNEFCFECQSSTPGLKGLGLNYITT